MQRGDGRRGRDHAENVAPDELLPEHPEHESQDEEAARRIHGPEVPIRDVAMATRNADRSVARASNANTQGAHRRSVASTTTHVGPPVAGLRISENSGAWNIGWDGYNVAEWTTAHDVRSDRKPRSPHQGLDRRGPARRPGEAAASKPRLDAVHLPPRRRDARRALGHGRDGGQRHRDEGRDHSGGRRSRHRVFPRRHQDSAPGRYAGDARGSGAAVGALLDLLGRAGPADRPGPGTGAADPPPRRANARGRVGRRRDLLHARPSIHALRRILQGGAAICASTTA